MFEQHRSLKHLALISFTLCLCLAVMPVAAQDAALNVEQIAEYDLGFDCPSTSTLDPDQAILWILMNNCGIRHFSLQGFHVADGTPVNPAPDADQFASALKSLDDVFIYSETRPFVFTSDNTLDLIYAEVQEYDTRNLRLTLDSSAPPADTRTFLPTLANLNSLIPGFSGYPEATVYNADHTLAAVMDTPAFHIIDLKSGADMLQIDATPDTNASKAYFAADGQSLYIATFDHPDDTNDYSATLRSYSLPDGDLLQSYPVPSGLLYISPDGRYAAAEFGENEIAIIELATGKTSPSISLSEAQHRVTQCVNSGKDTSDVDFTTSGNLYLMDLQWLPDDSGFFTVQSYLGEGAGGGSFCAFDYSRLRRYTLANE
ncbi:MAG: hypothetical protein ABI700_04130 [Chloroflexota bacterium]